MTLLPSNTWAVTFGQVYCAARVSGLKLRGERRYQGVRVCLTGVANEPVSFSWRILNSAQDTGNSPYSISPYLAVKRYSGKDERHLPRRSGAPVNRRYR
jgi:hypothetical protein